MDKFYVYRNNGFDDSYKKWWTTDETIIKGIKKARIYENLTYTFGIMDMFSFILLILFAACNILWLCWVFGILLFSLLFSAIILGAIGSSIYSTYIDKYEKSAEYCELKLQYEEQEALERYKKEREKAECILNIIESFKDKDLDRKAKLDIIQRNLWKINNID